MTKLLLWFVLVMLSHILSFNSMRMRFLLLILLSYTIRRLSILLLNLNLLVMMSKVTMEQLIEVAKEGAMHSPLLDFLYENRDNPLVMSIYLKGINSKENNVWFMLEFTLKAFLERLSQLKTIPKFNLFVLFALGLCALFPDSDVSPYIQFCGLETAAAIMIGSGLAATGAVGSSLINAGSQRSANEANKKMTEDTNETNLQIQREVNEQNYKIWQEQLGQRNAEIAYNSPVESRARSEMAGYNPYFADVPTGNIDSVLGATAPSMQAASMQAPHVDPVKYDFSGVGDAVNSYFQNSNVAAQAENIKIQNITQLQRDLADYNKKLADTGLSQEQRMLYQTQKDAILKKLPAEVQQIYASVNQMNAKTAETEANTAFIHAQTDYQNLLCEWFPEIQFAQLEQIKAGTKQALANCAAAFAQAGASKEQAGLFAEQAKQATAQALFTKAQEQGIILDNKQKERINDVLFDNAKKLGEQIASQTAANWNQATQRHIGLLGSFSNATPYQNEYEFGYKTSKMNKFRNGKIPRQD